MYFCVVSVFASVVGVDCRVRRRRVDNVGTPEILECPLWNLILVEDVGLHLLPRVEWAVTVWPADYNFVSAVV